jgi:hypothetical protein
MTGEIHCYGTYDNIGLESGVVAEHIAYSDQEDLFVKLYSVERASLGQREYLKEMCRNGQNLMSEGKRCVVLLDSILGAI